MHYVRISAGDAQILKKKVVLYVLYTQLIIRLNLILIFNFKFSNELNIFKTRQNEKTKIKYPCRLTV